MKNIILLLLFPILLFSAVDVLHTSEVYIDKNSSYTIKNIHDADFKNFKTLDTNKINLGYTTDTVWLKFSISNPTDKPLKKVLVLDNQMLDSIILFTKENSIYNQENFGIKYDKDFNDKILDFYFNLSLEANETRDYYLQVSSISSAVYFKLELMDKDELVINELNHQLILTMFFIGLLTLLIYNSFIYFFTKDINYIFYVGYLFFTLWNHTSYTGMNWHLVKYLPENFDEIDAYLSIFYMSLIVIFAFLFTRSFLNINKYKKIDLSVKIILTIIIILLIITSPEFYPIDIIALLLLCSLMYLVCISYYLLYKKEGNAKFFILGWTIALAGWIMLATYNYGYFSIIEKYLYFYEFTIFVEAVLFSMALSSKLNTTDRLKQQVIKNKVLTKELHHRVKNNMQFIISLYRLKLNESINSEVDEKLKDVENSIKAMSNIHEILYEREDLEDINTNEYFNTLLYEIQNTYKDKKVDISLNCTVKLDIQKAIYCGIILNELVTNSFKYAFGENKGKINISLQSNDNKNILTIKDDGKGYDSSIPSNGFGLELVESLVSNELKGEVEIDTLNKTLYRIIF